MKILTPMKSFFIPTRVLIWAGLLIAFTFSCLLAETSLQARNAAQQRKQAAAMQAAQDLAQSASRRMPRSFQGLYPMELKLRATCTMLPADGKQFTEIIAEVRDGIYKTVAANATVQFIVTGGAQLSANKVLTHTSGEARVHLTSTFAKDCRVTAFVCGASTESVDVTFTDEEDSEANSLDHNYFTFTAQHYLAYSVTDHAIVAEGKDGGGKMTYRNLQITADQLQLQCNDCIVRAYSNVTLKRGDDVIKAIRLYYNLRTSEGYIIAPDKEGNIRTYKLIGEHLYQEWCEIPAPSSYMILPEFQHKRVIVARSIAYFPGDCLQFKHAKFFLNSSEVMALPYYKCPLNSDELFDDQFINSGTHSLEFDLPIVLGEN